MKLSLSDDGDQLLVEDVPLRLNAIMKTIMGTRHVRGTDNWTCPASYAVAVQLLNELKSSGIEPTDDVRRWMGEEYRLVSDLYHYQTATDEQGNARLLPLQRVAVKYLLAAESGILGYDMGGGKTVIACDALAAAPQLRAILIVCPKGVMDVWRKHVHEWTTDVTPIIATDSSTARKKAIKEAEALLKAGRRVALIMNYESVWRHSRLAPYGNLRMEKCAKCDPLAAMPVTTAKCETCEKELNGIDWDVLISDEAHRVINISKQTRGLWYLASAVQYVWPCTGTPIRTGIADYWSLLHLVDPKVWSSRQRFLDRYCIVSSDSWGNDQVYGIKPAMQAEFDQITGRYMIRRTFEQIMAGLAERDGKTYVPIEQITEQRYVEMSKEQRSLYNKIADEIFVELEDGSVIYSDNGLAEMTRLLQCASAMLQTEGSPEGDDYKVHMVAPSAKVKEVEQIMDDLNGEPCIIFCVHRELAGLITDALRKKGIPTGLVHGGVHQEDRDREIELFQNGTSQVIVMTYATGAEGITLTRSRFQIRAQLSWSMILNKQSVHRNYRYGQENTVLTYIDLITADSVESRVYEAYADKLDALEAVVQDAKRMRELIRGK